jgi:hypothetical protein
MLCPRYSTTTAFKIMQTLAEEENFLCIPRIPNQLLDYMITLDYERTSHEAIEKEIVFVDIVGGDVYSYGLVSVCNS